MTSLRHQDATKRRRTPKHYKGVDLEQEAWRYCQHFGFKRNVELQVKHSARVNNTHGLQWNMVTLLTIGPFETTARVLQMLLHEICHVGHIHSSDIQETHPPEFIERLVFAARDIWGIDITGWQDVTQGRQKCLAYAIDDFLTARLKEQIAAGLYIPAGLEAPQIPGVALTPVRNLDGQIIAIGAGTPLIQLASSEGVRVFKS